MKHLFSRLIDLFYLIAIPTLLLSASRVLFLFVNHEDFSNENTWQLVYAVVAGLKYDFLLTLSINFLFIIFYLTPTKKYNAPFYQNLLKITYTTINSVVLLIGIVDIRYFQLHKIRMDYEVFLNTILYYYQHSNIAEIQANIYNFLILAIYWLIMVMVLSFALWFIKERFYEKKFVPRFYASLSAGLFTIFLINCVVFFSSKYTFSEKLHQRWPKQLVPIVINSPYFIMQTSKYHYLEEERNWMFKHNSPETAFKDKNNKKASHISLYIIESEKLGQLAVDYLERLKDGSFWKLNTLNVSNQSIFRYLDEMLIGIPGILNTDFYQSVYSFKRFEALPQLLTALNFETSLYTSGYDKQTRQLVRNFYGFKQYFHSENNEKQDVLIQNTFKIKNGNRFNLFLLKPVLNNEDSEAIKLENCMKSSALPLDSVQNLMIIYVIETSEKLKFPAIKKNLFVWSDQQTKTIHDSMVFHALDIMPGILEYISYQKSFVGYGTSFFSKNEQLAFASEEKQSHYVLKDGLLLNFANEKTNYLKFLNQSGLSGFDYKDSLVVEKILLENIMHSIVTDFKDRMRENRIH
jgi:uncharacterized membrane protein required for colicin V production